MTRARRRFPGRLLLAAVLIAGCAPAGTEVAGPVSLHDLPDSLWTRLAARRIYFGHQSVGGNLMSGVADLAASDPRLPIRVRDDVPGGAGGFSHGLIGRNGEPGLKTDEFAKRIDGDLRGHVDIAFHKYCYADLDDKSDVAAVFEHYRATMERLRRDHPEIVFVHVTAPLQRMPGGARGLVRSWLGRRSGRFAENQARERFNDLMRSAYSGREPLFDLAALESTRPGGSRERVSAGGETTFALVPAYTDDGSHLNEPARRRIAAELLRFLAVLPDARAESPPPAGTRPVAARP